MVATRQLLELGFSEAGIRRRVAAGQLHRHRGVYAVGHRSLSSGGCAMAAVLACGPDALLSHRSALELWGAVSRASGRVHVTVPGRRRGPLGIRVHVTSTLHPDDVATADRLPCTSVARSLLDFADRASEQQLQGAVEETERLRIFDGRAVAGVLERAAGRRGRGRPSSATGCATRRSATPGCA